MKLSTRLLLLLLPCLLVFLAVGGLSNFFGEADTERPALDLVKVPAKESIQVQGSVAAEAPDVLEEAKAVATDTSATAQFANWLQAYGSASKQLNLSLIEEGVVLARARRAELKTLIQEDPEQALSWTVAPQLRKELPSAVVEQLETIVIGEGFYGVLAICGHGPNEAEIDGHVHRIEREAVVGDTHYDAHVYGQGFERLTEEDASIFGVAIGDQLALHESKVVEVEPNGWLEDTELTPLAVVYKGEVLGFESSEALAAWDAELNGSPVETAQMDPAAGLTFDPASPPSGPLPPTDVYDAYTGRNSHQLGPKTMMVMVVRPSDGASYGSNVPTRSSLIAGLDSASQWYYGRSYKQTWFGPKEDEFGVVDRLVVTVELDLPRTVDYYLNSFSSLRSDAKAAVEALGGDWTNNGPKDPDRFDRWIVTAEANLTSSTGLAYVGGKFAWVGSNPNLGGGVSLHELGHNWGVHHAGLWAGDNGVPRNSSGEWTEYGDGADVMGGGGLSGFNPLFAERLGFLHAPDGDIVIATTSGTHRIFDHTNPEADLPSTRTRALKVPITGTNSFSKYLMFSLRHDGGNDGELTRKGWNRNALELHTDNTSSDSSENPGSHFLDTTLGSLFGEADRDDGGVLIGRTYSEPADLNGTSLYGAVHVTPIARGSISEGGNTFEYMDVVVELGDFSGNQAPNASISATATEVDAGVSLTLTANAVDPDSDPLAYSWTFGDGRYAYDNQPQQTINYATPGLYEVILTVSDTKGGIAEISQWINVGNQPIYDPVSDPGTVGDIFYRYYEGAFTALPDFGQLLPVSEGSLPAVSLSPRAQNDDFAFLYEGYLDLPTDDFFTFFLTSEDGSRLYIDDVLVIDNDGTRSDPVLKKGNIALKAGLHKIRVEFFHGARSEFLELKWKSLSTTGNQIETIDPSYMKRLDTASNAAPSVAITAPAGGSEFTFGSAINISADASDSDGIDRVVFFAGSTFIGEDATAPYTVNWTEATIGPHQLSAVAYDGLGQAQQSSTVAIDVVSAENRAMISLNFYGEASNTEAEVASTDVIGAFYAGANWNNLDSDQQNGLNGTVANLKDADGATTPASVTWTTVASTSFATGESTANTSTPAGRMMRGMLDGRKDQPRPTVVVSGIPYVQYDVYVYFERNETRDDHMVHKFTLQPDTGDAPAAIYGKNSLVLSDGVGDYPTYDTWTGFKESVATSAETSDSDLLGNYVVFRGVFASQITVRGEHTDTDAFHPGITGIQIVEAPADVPRLTIDQSAFTTEVSEAGGTDTLEVSLTLVPTNAATVTVDLSTLGQVNVSPASLDFTAADFDTPQTVVVTAVDDTLKESSPHTGTISFTLSSDVSSNYDAVLQDDLLVAVTDDDMPTLNATLTSEPNEAGPVAGVVQVSRNGTSSIAAPQTYTFTLSGTASPGVDYQVIGASGFDSGTGEGTAVIPGGSASMDLTFQTVNDTLGEGMETLNFALQANSAEYQIGNGSVTMTIIDDEILLDEDFESTDSLPSGWGNGSGDFDWTLHSGNTFSSNTGPEVDHSTGTDSGNYMYTEASGNSPEKTASLLTPTINMDDMSSAEIRFYTHMYGSDMGTLHIDVYADGTWTNSVYSLVGQQQVNQSNDWLFVSVDLTPYIASDTRVRFRMYTGGSYLSDGAIDDVQILGTSNSTPEAPSIFTDPQNQNLLEGETLTLTALASGSPSPNYQWRKDGNNLTDGGRFSGTNTNTLTVTDVLVTDSGSYDMVASNGVGSAATSAGAKVAVTAAPVIQIDRPSGFGNFPDLSRLLILESTVLSFGQAVDLESLSLTWSQVSGPGTVIFEDATAEDTSAVFDVAGEYEIQVTIDDGTEQDSQQISIRVGKGSLPDNTALVSYAFNESSGTQIFDTSGNANHGTLNGSATHPSGQIDLALQFGASGFNYIDTSASISATDSTGLSAATWIRIGAYPDNGSSSTILQHMDGSGTKGRTWLGLRSDGTLFTFVGGESTDGIQLPLNQWLYIAVTAGDGEIKLYVDGSVVGTKSLPVESNDAAFRIGNFKTLVNANQLVAALDEMRFYEGVLEIDEIEGLRAYTGNLAPEVDAGSDTSASVDLPVALEGMLADDGSPIGGSLSSLWKQRSGPAAVSFSDAANLSSLVTFSNAGTYTLRLIVDDGAIKVADDIIISVSGSLTPAETWRQLYFETTINAGDGADSFDYDHDGLVNLMERAFGTDPTDVLDRAVPRVEREEIEGKSYLTLTFRWDSTQTDLSHMVVQVDELTTPLAEWTLVPDTLLSTQNGIEQRKASVLIDSSSGFLRLRITDD